MSDRLVILLEKLTDNMELNLGGLRDQLRAELDALKAGQGEAVAWREHSAGIAKGEKCPATIETLQAAWDRDQELLLDQKSEISKLKETINQLRQKRSAPPATGVNVPSELLEAAIERIELNTHFPFGEPQTPEDAENRKVTDELRALLARSTAYAAARLVPVELLERIDGALTRHMDGHAPMRVPVDMTDSDIVQAELRALLARQQEVK